MAKANPRGQASTERRQLTLQLLGGLELRDAGGIALSLRTRKCALLLAYLAVAPGRAHPRDQLAGLLWGDRQDEQARGSLRNALSDLRKALGDEAFAVDRDAVSLQPGALATDYDRLHKAAQGEAGGVDLTAVYPGEFLEGHDPDAGDFTAWLLAEREKCRALAVRILEREVARLGEAREYAAAIDRARELLSLDTLREESHRILIRLYAAVGERSLAIAQFRNCRALIRRELGAEPSPETVDLADRIAAESHPAGGGGLAGSNGPSPLPPPAGHGDLSIAVLPFVNMSGDVEQDYFSDGVAEDIITDLSRIAELHVAARSSTSIYKGATAGPQRIAAELGVRYILDGSVRRAGTDLRITAQLVDGRSGRQLWAERYDRKLVNIFDLQGEIAASIVQALKLKISPHEERAIGKRSTMNVEAYQEYLRGRTCLREMTRRSVELSSMMFARAVELDPGYAAAYAGLADSASMLAYHYDDAVGGLADAVANSRRALELDPELAEAYSSRGRALSILNEVAPAEKDFLKAIEIDPRLQEAHFYLALMYLTTGRAKESLEPMRTAFRLADQDLQTGMMLMCSLRANGLSSAEVAGRMVAVAERRIAVNPSDERATYVGAQALAETGRTEEAMRWARRAAAFDTGDARTRYNLACLFSILGDVDECISQLRKMLTPGFAMHKVTWIRLHDPDLVNARKDPRFEPLFAAYVGRAG
jgi:TolB-like protein/DNA-binding SARP family transcriptional activator/tetratricopeptide (TPR) repeat protein